MRQDCRRILCAVDYSTRDAFVAWEKSLRLRSGYTLGILLILAAAEEAGLRLAFFVQRMENTGLTEHSVGCLMS